MLMAITRAVSPTLNRCELTHRERQPIDLEKADAEHHAYERCLRDLGLELISLPAEPDFPDAMFVEDPVVVLDEVAIITRMGAPSRRGEGESLARVLEAHRPLCYMKEPGTLDGGDVLRAGRTLYVGLSERTNAAGIQQLAAKVEPFGYRVKPVAVTGCLHLKSGASYAGDHTVLIHRPWVDAAAFAGMRLIDVPEGEEWGANILLLGKTVVMAKGFPKTAEALSKVGLKIHTIDITELMKAESGVTCSSLIFEIGPRMNTNGHE
jgi:dimethylargininase